MGELEKYGILSVGSVLVLFLVLTFRGGLPDDDARAGMVDPNGVRMSGVGSEFGVILGSSDYLPVPVGEQGVASSPTPARSQSVAGASDAAVSTQPRYHIVASGDTLGRISSQYLGAEKHWTEILAVNNGLDPRRLQVGRRLLIPPTPSRRRSTPASSPSAASQGSESKRGNSASSSGSRRTKKADPRPSATQHKIVSGDTLSAIAKRYYSNARMWRKIFDANTARLTRSDVLPVGTILTLP